MDYILKNYTNIGGYIDTEKKIWCKNTNSFTACLSDEIIKILTLDVTPNRNYQNFTMTDIEKAQLKLSYNECIQKYC